MTWLRVALALGGNLGDRIAMLRRGLESLEAEGVEIVAVSSVYETPPWGIEEQPHFANAAVSVRTQLAPLELLRVAKRIELALGRDPRAPRWSARPLDLDLVLAGEQVIQADELVVPHPRLHERAFVLVPLAEIEPDARHPVLGRSVRELLSALPSRDRTGLKVLASDDWYRGSARS